MKIRLNPAWLPRFERRTGLAFFAAHVPSGSPTRSGKAETVYSDAGKPLLKVDKIDRKGIKLTLLTGAGARGLNLNVLFAHCWISIGAIDSF